MDECLVCCSPDGLIAEVIQGKTVLIPCTACNGNAGTELSYTPNNHDASSLDLMSMTLDQIYKHL